MSGARSARRLLANAPVAVSVVRRHRARGASHTREVLQRFLHREAIAAGRRPLTGGIPDLVAPTGPYAAAVAAVAAGELAIAQREALRAGRRGRRLAQYVAGELGALRPGELGALGPGEREGALARTSALAPPLPGDPLRVLHLVTNALPETSAGYTVRTQGIVAAQREHGIDAQVVTRLGFPVTAGHLGAAPYAEVDGVPHHRLLAPVPLRPDEALARDVELAAALVERLRPDVLHAHSDHRNAQVALALRARYGIPVVYEVRGFLEETRRGAARTPPEAWRLSREAETWCMRQADAVVTLCETMRAEIAGRGVPRASIALSPNAVPGDVPGPDLPGPDRAGPLRIGAVGTVNGYEGLDVLVRALARLERRCPGAAELIVVGDGPARASLAEHARGLPVRFAGPVAPSEALRLLGEVDVVCVPRHDLPVTRLVTPLKLVEAMAAGRVVVASALPPLAELVRDGHTGLLVPPGDDAALADALGRLGCDPDLRARLGEAARSAMAEHTWSRAAARYAALYDRLIHPAPAAAQPQGAIA